MKLFRNLTLKKKLFSTLVIFVIVPLLVVGSCFSMWISNLDEKSSCDSSMMILKEVHKDVDKIVYDVEDVTSRLLTNSWMQKILLGSATMKNYWELKEWYDNTTRNKEYFSALCLSMDGQILYQRGEVVHKENPEYVNKMKSIGVKKFWSEPYILNIYLLPGQEKEGKYVITYYYGIQPKEQNNAALGISVPEEALCQAYQPYLNQESEQSLLINKDGVVMSSTDKSELGKRYSNYNEVKERLNGTQGYFKTKLNHNPVTVLYTKSALNDWYLINVVPSKSLVGGNSTYYYLIVLAVILCGVFGFAFAKIQENSIIKPLDRLLKEMKKLKKGRFDIQIENSSKDEIGTISNEFVGMSNRLNELIQEVYVSKIYNQEAELELLTSQINPHFLYNTLDSIHWLAVKNKDYDVGDQIEALADIFRHVLSRGKDMVTIEEEINHLENYMFIMNARYKNRAKVKMEVDDSLRMHMIPKLIIQPLVENAMLHGLEPKMEGGVIQVSVKKEQKAVKITVMDNGVGVDEEIIREKLRDKKEVHNVFALKNLDQRIKLKYGEGYGLTFKSEIGRGTVVEVDMPFEEEERDENSDC